MENIFNSSNIREILEVLILSLLIYYIIKTLKGTRAWIVVKGVLILFGIYMFAKIFEFQAIVYIFNNSIGVLTTALVIMFQPELRKMLEGLGKRDYINLFLKKDKEPKRFSDDTKDGLVSSVMNMSKVKTGALIVIEKNTPLNDYITSGIEVGAKVSAQLLENIFEHNTPLHDGAVIIQGNKIKAATCYLPLSENNEINKSLGTRHRAGIGISEITDCLVIIVSEETGAVSVSENGQLNHNIKRAELVSILNKFQDTENSLINIKKEKIRKRSFAYMALSICCGVMLWSVIISASDPKETKTISIPVKIVNENVVTDLGKSYVVTEGENVVVDVTGKRSVVHDLTSNDFIAEANFSRLSFTNAVPIEVKPNKNINIDISIKDSGTMMITMEDRVDIECVVEVQKGGVENNEEFYPKFKASVEKIKISGPKSKIKTVDKAITEFKITGNTDLVQTVPISVYDKNGNIMDLTDCVLDVNKVEITADRFATKEIPINIKADSYEIQNLVQEYETVKVAAKDNVLNKLDSLDIEINTENLNSNNIAAIINLKDYLPENVYLLSNNEMEVSGQIEKYVLTELSFSYKDVLINKKNMKVNFIDKEFKVTISHKKDYDVEIENLKPYIDVKDLEPGEYTLQIQFENMKNVNIDALPSASIKIS